MSNLRIILMNGGLGNQLYQYTFLRLLECTSNEKCIIDDSAFWGKNCVEHNGYELEKIFGIKLKKLSEMFTPDVWSEMIKNKLNGYSIPQQLADNGLNIFMVADARDYQFEGNIINLDCQHLQENTLHYLINTSGNVYYHGYFVNSIFVNTMREVLLQELVFPTIESLTDISSINLDYQKMITSTNSVCVHIRRGDFVKCGRALNPEKYAKSIEMFNNKYDDCNWFVFSDDIEWCKENADVLGFTSIKDHKNIHFITGNTGNGYNYIDMQLMSMCKKMIISNSSFGCWAYYLNTNPDIEMIMADNM